jgi:2,4-diaminopentanoate dehydrogenase
VNPGFLMDALPVYLTSVCQRVDRLRISRFQNAEFRRVPFQKKIGAGLTLEKFEQKRRKGTLRHVGLTESMHFIASSLGWRLDKIEETLSPVVAEGEIKTEHLAILPGMAAGVQQIGRGYRDGQEVITLLFRASVGEPHPEDTIEIKGDPDIKSTIPGGINGDVATCAITLNAAAKIRKARPGLLTMADMPAVGYSVI